MVTPPNARAWCGFAGRGAREAPHQSGTIGTAPDVLPLSIGDGELCDTALTTVSVPEMFRYWLQGGRISIGFLGAAQLDKFGNINTTVDRRLCASRRRGFPGGGGAPEIATSSRRDLHHHGASASARMVEKIDFFTSFGHGEGGDHRKRLGIEHQGADAADHRPLRSGSPTRDARSSPWSRCIPA